MESESSYNTPIFKDTEYTECSRCDGDGWIYSAGDHKVPCIICNGTGQIEITD